MFYFSSDLFALQLGKFKGVPFFEVWEEKYIPAEEAEGFVEDCKTAGEDYKKVSRCYCFS